METVEMYLLLIRYCFDTVNYSAHPSLSFSVIHSQFYDKKANKSKATLGMYVCMKSQYCLSIFLGVHFTPNE